MKISFKQCQEFQHKGVLLIKGLYDPNAINIMSHWLENLKKKHPKVGEEAKYYEKSPVTKENYLARVENIIGDHNHGMFELLINQKISAYLSQLFSDTPVLFKDKVNYKAPGSRPDMIHQDQSAGWGKYASLFISVLIAVDENRMDNAAVSFMKTGNYSKNLMSKEWTPLLEIDPDNLPKKEYQLYELDPGDVVFFDSYVPHGSSANFSNRQRRNIFLTFNAAAEGDHRKIYYDDKWTNYPPNVEESSRKADTFLV